MAGRPLRRMRRNPESGDAIVQRLLQEHARRGVDLSGLNLSGLDLRGVALTNANLSKANLSKANLSKANLYGANFYETTLVDANLEGANLRKASLIGANLKGAHLPHADLRGAGLLGARLPYAELVGANCSEADLRDVDLTGARLEGADLTLTRFSNAKLSHAYLSKADLTLSDLKRVILSDARLPRANLSSVDLTQANLRGANLYGANLEGANLRDANLEDANLPYANLSGANLSGANRQGADLEGVVYNRDTVWPMGFRPPPQTKAVQMYGSMTGPVLKFGKSDVPYKAKDFKQQYPQEFEMIKRQTGGADFSPGFAETLRKSNITPFAWAVTQGVYNSAAQRRCPVGNLVFKLNVRIKDDRFTPEQKKTLRALADASRKSGHPHEEGDLFTIGWVRICRNDEKRVWLIEEVQSDVEVVRQQKDDPGLGAVTERLDDVLAVMKPYVDRFYADAVGLVLIEAEKVGAEVEMLTYDTKKAERSPRSVYTDLPAAMGISAKRQSKLLPDLPDAVRWTRPNPFRRR